MEEYDEEVLGPEGVLGSEEMEILGLDDFDDDEIVGEDDDLEEALAELEGFDSDDPEVLGSLFGRLKRGFGRIKRGVTGRRSSRRRRRPSRARSTGRRPMRRPSRRSRVSASLRDRLPSRMPPRTPLLSAIPGVPERAQQSLPFGIGTVIWTNASTQTLVELVAYPQKPMRINRLVCVRNNVGVASPGLTVNVVSFKIGVDPQLAGAEQVPVELFGPMVQGVQLETTSAAPGIQVRLSLNISAIPVVGESVAISAGAVVDTLG